MKSDTKNAAVLGLLIDKSANRFDAEHVGDHCLNSTIPHLERMGIAIARERETVPCRGGTKTVSVKRYWVDRAPANMERARRLLAGHSSTEQSV